MYNQSQIKKIKEIIIEELYNGESLKSILETKKDMPSRPIIYQWLNKKHNKYDEDFFNNYIRAREDSADIDAETIQEIAKKTLEGEYKSDQARVAIDALKWTAGKKRPKKYGEKLDLSSSDGTMTPKIPDLSILSTDELIKRAELVDKLSSKEDKK